MTKIHSPKNFSYLMSYTDEDIATKLGVKPQTVISWRKKGLRPINNHRPTLYHGHNVKETLGKMNNRQTVKLDLHQFYCLGCKDVKTPLHGKIAAQTQGLQIRVIGVCPDCRKRISKGMNWDQFHQIKKFYRIVEQSQLYDSESSQLNNPTKTDSTGE